MSSQQDDDYDPAQELRDDLVAEFQRSFDEVAQMASEPITTLTNFDRGVAHGKLAAFAYAIRIVRGLG
jgi:hypothetical protein